MQVEEMIVIITVVCTIGSMTIAYLYKKLDKVRKDLARVKEARDHLAELLTGMIELNLDGNELTMARAVKEYRLRLAAEPDNADVDHVCGFLGTLEIGLHKLAEARDKSVFPPKTEDMKEEDDVETTEA